MNEVLTRLELLGFGVLLLLPAVVAARAARCNVRRAREAFSLPPLAHVTPAALAAQPPRGLPQRWPRPTEIDGPRREAYSRLARDRAENRMLVGELVLIVASAAAGAAITSAGRSTPGTAALTLAMLLGAIGVLLRNFLSARWLEIAAKYGG